MSDLPLIFRLMPTLYRDRDAGGGVLLALSEALDAKPPRRIPDGTGALLALSKVLDDARTTIKADIDALHRDWFAETCDVHLLPPIGELVGLLPFERQAHALRAIVADTIAFRQRKGSITAVERRLATLVGWPVRLSRGDSPGEVRAEVWPDEVLAFARATPCPARREDLPEACFHLDALGRDVQLVNPPRPYPGLDAPFVAALDAPVPLTRESPPDALARAISIYVGHDVEEPLPPEAVVVGDLGDWQPPAAADAAGIRAVVDPLLGRLVLLDVPAPTSVAVDYVRGTAARIGGGPYERPRTATPRHAWLAYVHAAATPDAARIKDRPPAFATVRAALAAFDAVPGPGVIRILDSGLYDVEGVEIGALPDACPPDPEAPRRLVVEAASGEAPCLFGALALRGRDPGLYVTLAGLWIDGTVTLGGPLTLEFEHCSLYPGAAWRPRAYDAPAIVAEPGADSLNLALRHCLCGPLDIPREAEVAITDSVVDGGRGGRAVDGGARARVERATFIGAVALWRLKAVDAIFGGRLDVAERLWGELRTSHLPADAHAPRRIDCLVALADVALVSLSPGVVGYARLAAEADERVRAGGSEGNEMGAHHACRVTRRLALLREGLETYLPPGCPAVVAAKTASPS